MNQARNTIINNIRHSLRRHELDSDTVNQLEDRLMTHTAHEQPVLEMPLIKLFINQLKKVSGTVESILNPKDIPFAILEFLHQHHLSPKMVVDTHLNTINWPHKLQMAYRAAQDEDITGVSQAFAGIAETGSLVLLSNPASPTTLNFLPDNHIIVLQQKNLVTHIEEVWTKLRTQPMPRTVNLITGPSRTADIEQTLQLGAHGPRRLHVILVVTGNK